EVWDAHIEDAHRGAVDEAQAYALAGTKQCRPVGGRRLAVDEISVGGARHVEDVGRAHAHFAPFEAIREGRGESVLARIREECAESPPSEIIIVALKLEI